MIATDAAFEVVKTFFFSSRYAERKLEPGICDFTFGNPHEMPVSFRPCARTTSRVARPSFEPIPRPPNSGGTSVWTRVIAWGICDTDKSNAAVELEATAILVVVKILGHAHSCFGTRALKNYL